VLDPEILFGLLQERKWDEFLGFLRSHKDEINKNPIALQALFHFHQQFEMDLDGESTCTIGDLKMVFLFDIANYYKFPEEMFIKSMTKYLLLTKEDSLKSAYGLACQLKNVPLSKEIINDYEKTQPVMLRHRQESRVNASYNQIEAVIGSTIPLFKSKQESEFFKAVVACFPNYQTYPNVAVSCLVDFDSIKSEITGQQRDYFFKSIVDCVVFDVRTYMPKYFFEIDSVYHDAPAQKEKDATKDRFFSLCGEKLYRIRSSGGAITAKEFEDLIHDVVEKKI
jgi:hypothetical protein